jgi:hypothetical protein
LYLRHLYACFAVKICMFAFTRCWPCCTLQNCRSFSFNPHVFILLSCAYYCVAPFLCTKIFFFFNSGGAPYITYRLIARKIRYMMNMDSLLAVHIMLTWQFIEFLSFSDKSVQLWSVGIPVGWDEQSMPKSSFGKGKCWQFYMCFSNSYYPMQKKWTNFYIAVSGLVYTIVEFKKKNTHTHTHTQNSKCVFAWPKKLLENCSVSYVDAVVLVTDLMSFWFGCFMPDLFITVHKYFQGLMLLGYLKMYRRRNPPSEFEVANVSVGPDHNETVTVSCFWYFWHLFLNVCVVSSAHQR